MTGCVVDTKACQAEWFTSIEDCLENAEKPHRVDDVLPLDIVASGHIMY
jgi:hypothetical protein